MVARARPPERARRSDFESNRRRILRAAREITAERGPESLTVSEVARRAGLNRTTAYQHFPTRDDLVGAVMNAMVEDVTQMLVQPLPLDQLIDHLADYMFAHPEFARLALHQLLSENLLPQSGLQTYLGEVRRIATGPGVQPGIDDEMLSYLMVGMGALWPLLARTLHEDEASANSANQRFIREFKRLLLHGALQPDAWPELQATVASDETSSVDSLEPRALESHVGPDGVTQKARGTRTEE